MTPHHPEPDADLARPSESPGSFGYRWPAEWEPHAATWLSWPHNRKTWPGSLEAVESVFGEMVCALWQREDVCINVTGDPMEEAIRARLRLLGVDPDRGIRFFPIASDDAWIRDHGPIFLVRGTGVESERALVDFEFNAWGGKYPPWDLDNAVPGEMAEQLGIRLFEADRVLEGGSIDGNGRSSVFATESCLLNPNRACIGAAGLAVTDSIATKDQVEEWLARYLGCDQILWLGEGIEGDDTDGHVDNLARFVSPHQIVAPLESDSSDVNFGPLRENMRRLKGMCDVRGRPFEIISLPMPPRIEAPGPHGSDRLPASYANFYLANDVALVPVFDAPSDERALKVLAECLPDREIVAIPSRDLVLGLGAVHCLTLQEPGIGSSIQGSVDP